MKTLVIAAILLLASRAEALFFNVPYDASVAGAAVGFIPGFTEAIHFYQNTFTDPIAINLAVGWGEISGFRSRLAFLVSPRPSCPAGCSTAGFPRRYH